ncbi:MAG TPA: fibrobacter succinogenes major paralogous domain-containing protein [Prolixibacteraceae bacterium]|jgi:uncharacterized protein (TIGR02145 family)|nr:fibrobacter succinogenes major paralogous domain-containing protein [Paludibacter sp.]HOS91087.1 fibrobacter succinogenes major paralogous domain-containing protein [Prolixibacteraceae bacterium]HQE52946.1 fibrobacter succinogenes major paralogous domain-containing protein [Prolixibacteraceae bacterium]HQH77043.1 fibrobacter succinogenes major paralogous domain-containing protein [Prolixibacteraceae bacterium]HQJ86308.1 fibrobacter succinogenes major paralogous domain-containing protein [Pro
MKTSIILTAILFCLALTVHGQHDTLYFIKNKVIINKQSIKKADLDSAVFYRSVVAEPDENVFVDARDGNSYPIITIADQVWMGENLRYLPSVSGPGTLSDTDPKYYVYGYDGTDVAVAKALDYYSTYGVLYNWPAAVNACPSGWHIATDAEWTQLTNFAGGENAAGGKLKETGTVHWQAPNNGATDEYGFSALPTGFLKDNGTFMYVGQYGYWWTGTESGGNNTKAWRRYMLYNNTKLNKDETSSKKQGFTVRCIKD